jgi:AmmeMemoRadiSam system protein B
VLVDFTRGPVAVGAETPDEMGEVLEALWDGPETLVVIRSDLSPYDDDETAPKLDRATTQAIERLWPQDMGSQHVGRRHAVRGLLCAARQYGLRAQPIDVRNSGDIAGPCDCRVGYGLYGLTA